MTRTLPLDHQCTAGQTDLDLIADLTATMHDRHRGARASATSESFAHAALPYAQRNRRTRKDLRETDVTATRKHLGMFDLRANRLDLSRGNIDDLNHGVRITHRHAPISSVRAATSIR